MVSRESLAELIEHLGLQRKPVAVRYDKGGVSPEASATGEKLGTCEALIFASEGHSVHIGPENSSCILGPYVLGLGKRSAEESRKAFEEMLFDRDKASCFIEEIPGAQASGMHPVSVLGDSLRLSPLEAGDPVPDLVLFICNFDQACKLIALDCHGAEAPAQMEMRGASCYRAITYPLISGNLNVTLMNHAGRRIHGYRADDLLISVPLARFARMLENLGRLVKELLDVEIPDTLRSLLRERCRGSDN